MKSFQARFNPIIGVSRKSCEEGENLCLSN
jgi:hypothetical protein